MSQSRLKQIAQLVSRVTLAVTPGWQYAHSCGGEWGVLPMVDRADELKETAAQCLALAHTTSDPQTRTALLTMAQKLYERANTPPADYEAAQRAFNDQQMLPRSPMQQPASPMQQQQQIQPKKAK